MRRAPALALTTLVLSAAVPTAAHATLVYDKNTYSNHPSVWVAKDDGTSPRRLGAGYAPDLSPDGKTVTWVGGTGERPVLVASSTTTPKPFTLAKDWQGRGATAWSPDSKVVATVVGTTFNKPGTLETIDPATGKVTTVATGFFNGASFSPDGTKLIYARGAKDDYKFDLAIYDFATKQTTTLTRDRRAQSPVWGPKTIVFTRLVDASVRKYGPKGELYTIAPDGSGLKRLTSQKVGSLLFGTTATAFSADGSRLLAQFGGQDTSYAQRVDMSTGAIRTVGPQTESGYQGYAITKDGKTILAARGGFDPQNRHDIVTVPYAGGPAKVLVKNSTTADWDR